MTVIFALRADDETHQERDNYAEAELEVVMNWRGRRCLAAAAPAARIVFAARLVGQLR